MKGIVPRRAITTDDRRGVGVVNASVAEGCSLGQEITRTSKSNIERISQAVYPQKGCSKAGMAFPLNVMMRRGETADGAKYAVCLLDRTWASLCWGTRERPTLKGEPEATIEYGMGARTCGSETCTRLGGLK